VRWTPEAEADALAITDWFQDDVRAEAVIAQFVEKAQSLATMSERGRVVPELQKIGVMQYRELIHRPWRMVYSVRGREVWIMAILDARRLQDQLFARLMR
jgi:toxin ParE1/3/4